MLRRSIGLLLLLCTSVALGATAFAQSSSPVESYQIVHVYPHDPEAFTQGLVYENDHLYESTGRKGKSSIRMVDLTTGRVLQHYDLAGEYFGEGLTVWGTNLVQLTWTTGTGFV